MEGTHGQLGTRLTDRLGCNNTYSLTNLYRLTGSQVCTVTFRTDSDMRLTGQDCTDLHACLVSGVNDLLGIDDAGSSLRRDHMICLYNEFSVVIVHILACEASCDTLFQ